MAFAPDAAHAVRILDRAKLTIAALVLEVLDEVAHRLGVDPSDPFRVWANERWAQVAGDLDGVLNGPH